MERDGERRRWSYAGSRTESEAEMRGGSGTAAAAPGVDRGRCDRVVRGRDVL